MSHSSSKEWAMVIGDIAAYMEDDMLRIKELMRTSLSCDIDLLNTTNEAIMDHPGKMLRPMLSLLCAKACSGGSLTEDSYSFAAATELLHNATLLHDDVADKASSRRGRPTVMSLLGNSASVLLGDFWLVKAMDRILGASVETDRVIRLFSRTLGDLAEGEMLQLQKASSGDTTEDDYFRIIFNKTASLFEAAAMSGAISVGAGEEYVRAVKEYADIVGIAFQIKDDIFDYESGASIGKPVGHDLMEQKITLPLLGALAAVPEEEAGIIRKKVCGIHEHPEYQEEIVRFVREEGGMEYAYRKLGEYVDMAVAALDSLPDGRDRDCLVALAGFIADRNS